MRWLVAAGIAVLAATGLLATAITSAPAAGGVPPGFMGVVVSDPTLLSSPSFFRQEAAVMRQSGVQTVRIPVYWATLQPSQNGPIQFQALDTFVQTAAQNRLRVLPTVLSSPPWAAMHPNNPGSSPPRDPQDYAAFMAFLVKRYGPGGVFWKAHASLPQVPIQTWQIWNEPSLNQFWNVHPYAPPYVALLKASRAAMRKVDPSAQIMLAGLPDRSWAAMKTLYEAGAKPYFDIAALHPYTHSPAGVLQIVSINRRVMAHYGDQNKPVALTEIGWATDPYGTPDGITWNTNIHQQATNLADVYSGLARDRNKLHVISAEWFTWYSPEDHNTMAWEDFTGLRVRKNGKTASLPALVAFSQTAHKLER